MICVTWNYCNLGIVFRGSFYSKSYSFCVIKQSKKSCKMTVTWLMDNVYLWNEGYNDNNLNCWLIGVYPKASMPLFQMLTKMLIKWMKYFCTGLFLANSGKAFYIQILCFGKTNFF